MVTLTNVLDDNNECMYADKNYEFLFPDSQEIINNSSTLQDGIKVTVKLISNDGKADVAFPNFLWRSETIIGVLEKCGFSEAKCQSMPGLPNRPVRIITAVKLS